jgi:hypothetical protein
MTQRIGHTGKNQQIEGGYRGSADNPETIAIPFASIPLETSGQALEVALSGYKYSVASMTDAPGEFNIARDKPRNYQRVSVGFDSPLFDDIFMTLWIQRCTTTPNTPGLLLYLTAAWDQDYREAPISPRIQQSGAGNWVVTGAYSAEGFEQVVAARSGRRLLGLVNVDASGHDHYVSPVDEDPGNNQAVVLRAEAPPLWLPYSGPCYSDAPASIEAQEIF